MSQQSPALRPVPGLLAPELTQTAAELAPSGNGTRDLTVLSEVLFLATSHMALRKKKSQMICSEPGMQCRSTDAIGLEVIPGFRPYLPYNDYCLVTDSQQSMN